MRVEDVKVGVIYTPYHLNDFQKCPRFYDYKKRWQPRDEGQKTAMLVGSAVALGLEMHYRGCASSTVPLQPVEFAESYVRENYLEDSDRSFDSVMTLVRRGVKHGMATNLGLSEILGVEKFYGRIKPDLVGRDSAGKLVVVDHKVKMRLGSGYEEEELLSQIAHVQDLVDGGNYGGPESQKALTKLKQLLNDGDYKEKELLGFDVSNQMHHYAWAVGQHYGETIDRVIIHMIVLAPRVYTEIHPIKIDQERLALWLQDAAKDWRDMDRGENRGRYGSCLGKYGKCEMHDACHILNCDESQFPVLYDRRPERRG